MKQRSKVVLVLSDINSFRLLPGIHKAASSEQDYWLIDASRPIGEIRQLIDQWKPDGIIVEWMPFVTEIIVRMGFPTVVTVGEAENLPVPSVDVNDTRIGEMAASHLLSLSLQNFAFLGDERDYARQRELGYRMRLEEASYGCESFFLASSMDRKYIEHWHEAQPELIRWIHGLDKPIGIFAGHDPSGRLLAQSCREESIRIPEDVAIIAANNDPHVCDLTYPPLSSIEIPWDTIGYESALMMNVLLDQPSLVENNTKLIPPIRVVRRRSSDFLSVSNPTLASALEYIHENACNGIGVTHVVHHLRANRRSLEREFQKTLGRTIYEQIVRERIDRAKQLLLRRDLAMDQVAQHCGFGRNERLTVNFKKMVGSTPSEYRKKLHNIPKPNDPSP